MILRRSDSKRVEFRRRRDYYLIILNHFWWYFFDEFHWRSTSWKKYPQKLKSINGKIKEYHSIRYVVALGRSNKSCTYPRYYCWNFIFDVRKNLGFFLRVLQYLSFARCISHRHFIVEMMIVTWNYLWLLDSNLNPRFPNFILCNVLAIDFCCFVYFRNFFHPSNCRRVFLSNVS